MIDAIRIAALVLVACEALLLLAVGAVFAYARGVTLIQHKRMGLAASRLLAEIDQQQENGAIKADHASVEALRDALRWAKIHDDARA